MTEEKNTIRLEGEKTIEITNSVDDGYFPMDDYANTNYAPKLGRDCHFCTACIDYYEQLHAKKVTTHPFMPKCRGDASIIESGITRASMGDDYDYYRLLQDPVAWAEFELDWKARWYQIEILRCTSQFKALRAGRRVGKTECMAILALWNLFMNGGLTDRQFEILVIAPYQLQVAKIFDVMRTMIKRSDSFMMPGVIKRDVQNPQIIELSSGGIVKGLSSGSHSGAKSDKIRGQSANLIVIDEIDYVNDADIEVIMAILASHAECQLIVASTPKGIRQKLHQWCFPADTLVMTPAGTKRIDQFSEGDEVLSASGHKEQVSTVFKRQYTDDLVKIECKKTIHSVSSTLNHPHLAIPQGSGVSKPRFIPASELQVGDWIGITTNKSGNGLLPKATRLNDAYTDSRFSNNSFDMARFLQEGYDGCRDRRILKNIETSEWEIDRINRDPHLQMLFMKLLGIYIAEGNILPEGRGIQLSFAKSEDLADIAVSLIDALWPGLTVKRVEKDNGRGKWEEVHVYATWLSSIFISCGGQYSDKKSIHPDLLGSKFMDELFDGYWRGDGWQLGHGSKAISTTSPVLADQIWRYLLQSGTQASLSRQEKNDRKDVFTVYILKKDTNQIKWYAGMPFFQIKDTTRIPFDGLVYNLETNKSHTYSANGFATHNCTEKNQKFKEFWYVSAEAPSWTESAENIFKTNYTEAGYQREFLAEFGDEVEGVFRSADINAALADYDVADCIYHSQCKYVIGVDWNKSTGTHITVVEALQVAEGPFKYRLVDKRIIRKSEFQQLKSIEIIMEMDKKWNASYIYVDAGYGHTQVEVMWKYDVDHPAENTRYRDRVIPITMNQNMEIRDPVTGEIRKKQIKQFMVDTAARAFEQRQVILPKNEDTITRIIPTEIAYAHIGLVQQARNFTILKWSPTGVPSYSQDYEHTLTAWMLAIMGHFLQFSDVAKVNSVHTMTYSEGMGSQFGREASTIPGMEHLPPKSLEETMQEVKTMAKDLRPVSRVHQDGLPIYEQQDVGALVAGQQSIGRRGSSRKKDAEDKKKMFGRGRQGRPRRTSF